MTQPPPGTPPVAFRLKRPYASEDEFVAGDGHGIAKNGMVLIGAGPRPVGVIVRFEVALKDGAPLFRGEGRVIAHRSKPDGDKPAGLEVKFSRLDARGKSLVDRALQARGASRRMSEAPPPSVAPPPIPDIVPPPARASDRISMPPAATSTGPVEAPPEPAPSIAPPPEAAAPPDEPTRDDLGRTQMMPAAAPPSEEPEPAAPEPEPERTEIAPPVAIVAEDTPTPPPPVAPASSPPRERIRDERTLPYEFPLKPAPGSVLPPKPEAAPAPTDRDARLAALHARPRDLPPDLTLSGENRTAALQRLRARSH